jgi:hypothetical protein
MSSVAIRATKLTAFRKKHPAIPTVAITTPPIAGPRIRERLKTEA